MTSLCLPSVPATPANEVRIKNEFQLSCSFLCTVGFVDYNLIEFARVITILLNSGHLKDWTMTPEPEVSPGCQTNGFHRMTVVEHKARNTDLPLFRN